MHTVLIVHQPADQAVLRRRARYQRLKTGSASLLSGNHVPAVVVDSHQAYDSLVAILKTARFIVFSILSSCVRVPEPLQFDPTPP